MLAVGRSTEGQLCNTKTKGTEDYTSKGNTRIIWGYPLFAVHIQTVTDGGTGLFDSQPNGLMYMLHGVAQDNTRRFSGL